MEQIITSTHSQPMFKPLSQVVDSLSFEHGYFFKDLEQVFKPSFDILQSNFALEELAIISINENEKIEHFVSFNHINIKKHLFSLESVITKRPLDVTIKIDQTEIELLSIRRGVNILGYLVYKKSQESTSLMKVVAGLFAHPLHLFLKSRQVLTDSDIVKHKQWFHPPEIIGKTKTIAHVLELAQKIIDSSTTILILGESGVGKEQMAKVLHKYGPRSKKPFVGLNCAAIPTELIESELFGHMKGSFTGAISDQLGKIEKAQGGTLFLDEIGDLPLPAQAKLLRFLQDKTITPVGSTTTKVVDVRIIAATNHNLEKLVADKGFRLDLYYRLNIFPLFMPALKERREDILLLADHFIKKFSMEHSKDIRRLSTSAIDMLMSYHWPGNIRELSNVIERAVLLNEDGVIQGGNLPPSLQTAKATQTEFSGELESYLDQVEKDIIIDTLKNNDGSLRHSAKALGLTERKLGLRIKKHQINIEIFKYKS